MRNKHITLLGILFLSLVLISSGFMAGYLAVQSLFAVPKDIASYILNTKNAALSGNGFENPAEDAANDILLLGTATRLDVYVITDDENHIQRVVIGKLNAADGTAKLITVPTDTKISLPDSLYRTLVVEFPAIPQLFELEILEKYVSIERLSGVLTEIFSKLFLCQFSGAWHLETEQAAKWFDLSQKMVALSEEAADYMDLSAVKKQALSSLSAFEAALADGKHVQERAGIGTSFIYYAETLAGMSRQDIAEELISGVQQAENYNLDTAKAARQLSQGKK